MNQIQLRIDVDISLLNHDDESYDQFSGGHNDKEEKEKNKFSVHADRAFGGSSHHRNFSCRRSCCL